MRRAGRELFWLSSATLGLALVFVAVLGACGDGDSETSQRDEEPPEDFVAEADDFRNINTMTPVRNFFLDNPLGHLDEALEVAHSPDGGRYPVGTIIQLVPQEAMVKRHEGFSPTTNDWEFFFLTVSPEGTVIESRGTTAVENQFGADCATCHAAAEPRFDFICEDDHGCAPLPIGRDLIRAVQSADPRA